MKRAPSRLVRDLLDPAGYPPPRPSRVHAVTTHASIVFLTDRHAWKLKRPVRYPFLDYSTPSRRRRFCFREVAVNRPLAPGVYLGVVPVRKDSRGCSFHRPGKIVDWAVRMVRLPERERASRLRLTRARIAVLAEFLARFTEGCPVRRRRSWFRELAAAVRGNGRDAPTARGRGIAARQAEFLRKNRRLFEERLRQGRVRLGHGDLRLEHVYFRPAGPILLDAVEFDDRYRIGDVALDIAFLAMDLAAAGKDRTAELLLARWASATGDFDFYPLADFYVSYRAMVRAKVAHLLAKDAEAEPALRRAKAREARDYLQLAARVLRRRPKPALIVVCGTPGSGKSSVAEALSERRAWPVISSDIVRKQLGNRPLRMRAPARMYAPSWSRRTYETMFHDAAKVLASGRSAILDATFGHRASRARAREIARRAGARILFVETRCPEAIVLRRLRARSRGPSISDAGVAVWRRMRGRFEPFHPSERALGVDTGGGMRKALQRLRKIPEA